MLKEISHHWWSRPPRPRRRTMINSRRRHRQTRDYALGISMQSYPTLVFVRTSVPPAGPQSPLPSNQYEENKITANLVFGHAAEINRLRPKLITE
ncbi:hypothetical protein FOE78_03195 [Microlunatus elymi]|uniref:Uncharacterized protein n=1 Tax=Microlunatus elymi TaxID=2596828 RepID=A0A516PVS2_9ACTN|nr:hypothetical protein [Microlunatus elymi]QDP95051.1 hypothetical protein FOE78_03195 [Microlunatus elymi]